MISYKICRKLDRRPRQQTPALTKRRAVDFGRLAAAL